VTESINVPTIGIGAGPHTDGQVLVINDLVGLENGVRPKFVRRYAELAEDATKAVSAYASDVRSGLFPNQSETYHASSAVAEEISIYGSKLNS
jgi:3-methyl-2-oxobutanoate hydroxymethyltransferase